MPTVVNKKTSLDNLRDVEQEFDELKGSHPNRKLVVREIIGMAKSPESAMHEHFTWDLKKAAWKCWETEARALIRLVYISNPVDPSGPDVPGHISLIKDRGNKDGGGYTDTNDVIASKELTEQMRLTAQKELEAWMRRHALLTDLCEAVARAAGLNPPQQKRRKA